MFDWGESTALVFFALGIFFGMLTDDWRTYVLALIFGLAFAKFLLRAKTNFPSLLQPFGFLLGLMIGSVSLIIALPYLAGIWLGYRVHERITTLDY